MALMDNQNGEKARLRIIWEFPFFRREDMLINTIEQLRDTNKKG